MLSVFIINYHVLRFNQQIYKEKINKGKESCNLLDEIRFL